MATRKVRIAKTDVPQKEDISAIIEIPGLIRAGICSARDIAAHFRQHVRHGHFLIHACKILGWIDGTILTEKGLEVANSDYDERLRLARDAILETALFKTLLEIYGPDFFKRPDASIMSDFLHDSVGFSRSTSDRRAGTIVAWVKFVQRDVQPLPSSEPRSIQRNKKVIIRPFSVEGRQFDVGYHGEDDQPDVVIANTIIYGMDRCLRKIGKLKSDDSIFLLIGRESDYLAFEIALRSEFRRLRGRVHLKEMPYSKKEMAAKAAESILCDDRKVLILIGNVLREHCSSMK